MTQFIHNAPLDCLEFFRVIVSDKGQTRTYLPVAEETALPLVAQGFYYDDWLPAYYLLVRTKATGDVARYYPVPELLKGVPPAFAAHQYNIIVHALKAWKLRQ